MEVLHLFYPPCDHLTVHPLDEQIAKMLHEKQKLFAVTKLVWRGNVGNDIITK